jgi:hypothetical protein
VAVDYATGEAAIGAVGAGAAVAWPVAIYLFGLWGVHLGLRADLPRGAGLTLLAAVLILATPWTSQPVLLTGLIAAGLLAIKLVLRHRGTAATPEAASPSDVATR